MRLTINNRVIGAGYPTYIVAEMSANHNQDFEQAVKIIEAAKDVGADAVKIQTYTPDTLTIDCGNEYFRIKGNVWEGQTLYDLYRKAYTPWEWQPKLKAIAEKLDLDFFSTPFDATAVDFLEKMAVPAYKIASFELIDMALIRKVAETKKPVIMSTGMATLAEIDEAVQLVKETHGNEVALLKCTSAYPTPMEDMNLKVIPHLSETFGVPVGLSDHTLGTDAAVAAVALGASIVEKHFTLSRDLSGADSTFSLEPQEFKAMVEGVRNVEKALGQVQYEMTEKEKASRMFRRSLFIVKDMKRGEAFNQENTRSIRPGFGLHTRYLDEIMGLYAAQDISCGTPLSWDLIDRKTQKKCLDI